jgi:hypothetical protein
MSFIENEHLTFDMSKKEAHSYEDWFSPCSSKVLPKKVRIQRRSF